MTGDIAFRFMDYVGDLSQGEMDPEAAQGILDMEAGSSSSDSDGEQMISERKSHVTVCDINQAMLDVGQERAQKQGRKHGRISPGLN